jgi:hypothetical protein
VNQWPRASHTSAVQTLLFNLSGEAVLHSKETCCESRVQLCFTKANGGTDPSQLKQEDGALARIS